MPGHSRYKGMLAIPYLSPAGYPLTVRFRRLEGEGSKYLSMPDDPSRMYNVGAILKADHEIHIAEGEPDCWVLQQLGYHAVAVGGAQAFKYHYQPLLVGFSRVFVWGDGDDAGADMVSRIGRALPRSRGVRVPRDMDVNDLLLQEGADAIHKLVEEAR